MRFSTKLITTFAVASLALTPVKAHAAGAGCSGVFQLGLGGYLSGCWNLTVSRLFENASDFTGPVSWFGTPFGRAGNAPTGPQTVLWSDYEAGSSGMNATTGVYFGGTFFGSTFVNPTNAADDQTIAWNGGELIFGLQNSNFGWVYSGVDPSRNNVPFPPGLQNVLLRVTDESGNDTPYFLFGWEDWNSGCTADNTPSTIKMSEVVNSNVMNALAANCTALTSGGISDNDFNDFYFLISADQIGIPQDAVPEPMTMSLLATGLVGLGGASLRKRNKKS